ncbi:hypothetical protein Tco_0704665 [Tanacetum coccineum]|uniref:CCHC-type domain-containing protein n=1 Tax=Tanacetum coccineum TaxID=301880 RepID=A0ABQ4Y2P9_9ASTR
MKSSVQFICVFCGSLSNEYGCPCSTCELCGNDAHYGYDCPSQVPFVYNQDPCFNQNLDNFSQTSPSFPQQYLCCEDCGGPHATFECQPMNHSTSFSFDQFQPPQYPVIHQPRQEMSTKMLLAKEKLIKAIRTCLKNNNQPPEEKSIAVLLAEKSILTVMQTLEEKHNDTESMQKLLLQLSKDLQTLGNTSNQLKQEEQDSSQYWKPPIYYSDNDDDFYRESIDETPPSDEITPDLPITDSLVMEDKHLDTIPETDSDDKIESSVKNLNLIPSESEDLSDYVSKCDLPIFDDSPLDVFEDNCVIFSRPLFDSYGDSTSSEYSSDNESFLEEYVFSNLPYEFNLESISSDVNPIYDEVLEDIDGINYLNDSIIDFSPMIDSLLQEFTGELALINPIPPGIAGANFDPEGDISLVEKLLYDNSSPRPPKELNSKISDAIIESFSSSPIPVKDSDSLMEEINIFLVADDSIPSGIDSDGYNSEEDNLFLEYEPDPGELTRVVVEDIFGEPRVHMPNVLPTHPTLCQDLDFTLSTDFSGSDLVVSFPSRNRNKTFDTGISIEVQSKRSLSLNKFSISFISDPLSLVLETLLPFSSKIEDKVFNPGIPVSKEEKSPHLLSRRGFKAFKIIYNFLNENSMMIYGGDMPILDDSPDYEDSRAHGNGYSQKDKNEVKTDKTEHEIGKSMEKPKPKACAS